MSRKYNTRPKGCAQPHSYQENCTVPAADGVQGFELTAGSQRMVSLGHEWASAWLDDPESQLLHLEMLHMRQTAPMHHWADIETGIYCRIDQRLRSEIGGEHRSQQRRESMIALGDQVTMGLLQLLLKTAALASREAIVANSSEGAYLLREIQAQAASIDVLGKAQL